MIVLSVEIVESRGNLAFLAGRGEFDSHPCTNMGTFVMPDDVWTKVTQRRS